MEETKGQALEVNLRAPCWIFQGAKSHGYGVISRNGRSILVHRYMWEQMRGPIPEGMELDHLCRVLACVNPQHLEPVTHRENLRRGGGFPGIHARATHCPQGHPYDEANTRIRPSGWRDCRACNRASQGERTRRWMERRKAGLINV